MGVIRVDFQQNRTRGWGRTSPLTAGARRLSYLGLVLTALLAGLGASASAQEVGTVEGVVIDSKTGDPIIEAGIEVIDQNKKVKTDLDGKYSLKLLPGSYELRIFAPLYQGTRLKNVIVTANQITRADANLKPEGEAAVETVEVVAEAKKSAETTQMLQRQKAAVVSDNISAQQIAKSPDSKASEIVRRVPAVTIKDNKFIVVRGLGERYSTALLNGSRLPSTDPNKRVIPLDLFPADFIDALTIIKTYTPDLPGDFAGGLLDIQLREFPARFTWSLGVQTSINTATTFQDFGTYHGCGASDYFGFGDCRDLPSIFGDKPLPPILTTPQQQRLVGSLPINWNIERQTAPPNFSVNGSVGNTWGPFGFNLAAIYKTEYKVRRDEAVNSYPDIEDFETGHANNVFTYDQSDFETQLGAILTSGYQLSPNHKFFGNALVNRRSDDQTLNGQGRTNAAPDFPTFSSNQLYTQDQLGFGQIGGRHHWDALDADWRAAWSPSSEDQPDAKFLAYIQPDAQSPPHITDSPAVPTRTFATLNEFLQDYNADLTAPFKTRLPLTDVWSGLAAKLKGGVAYTHRHRNFDYRRLITHVNDLGQLPGMGTLPPDQLLIPPNYGEPDNFPLTFQDNSMPSDTFSATQEIAGAYGMFDLPLVPERLRFVGGVRLEYSYIATDGFLAFSGGAPGSARINNLDPLPGANFIYTPRNDMNVRYSVSATVSRPEFRELTPTQFVVPLGQRSFVGNPFLVETHIISNDLRWEWFFTPLELVSASFFYKDLSKPIEIVAISSTSQELDTPANADSATLWGFEFELRKNFGFLVDYVGRWEPAKSVAPELNNLQFLSNVSIVTSNATGLDVVPQLGFPPSVVTNANRSLVGQADYVINAALEYQNATWGVWRLLYNTVGPYIVAAGVDHLPDIQQQPRNQLDAVWITQFAPFGVPLTGKVGIENILNDRYLQTQGDRVTNRYLGGVKFTFGVSYTY